MADHNEDRPYGDDGFSNPRKHGWLWHTVSILSRSVTAVFAGLLGRQWPRQLPLDEPKDRRDYRP